jgi:putative flippase GtrA
VLKPTRFVRFSVTGGIAAAVNICARWALNSVMSYELSVALAYLAGMTIAFILMRIYVFDRTGEVAHRQYIRFSIVNAVACMQVWIVSVGLARFAFPALGFAWHTDTVAHVIGVSSPVVTSYFAHKDFSFRKNVF